MPLEAIAFAASILLLFPMFYFLVTTFAFFLRSLEHPSATILLRGVFSVCFLAVAVFGAIGAAGFAGAGRTGVAAGAGLVALLAFAARTWFLARIDRAVQARDGGDAGAVRQLRRLQVGGMAYNAAQFLTVLGSIPAVFPNGI